VNSGLAHFTHQVNNFSAASCRESAPGLGSVIHERYVACHTCRIAVKGDPGSSFRGVAPYEHLDATPSLCWAQPYFGAGSKRKFIDELPYSVHGHVPNDRTKIGGRQHQLVVFVVCVCVCVCVCMCVCVCECVFAFEVFGLFG
jgi:hypothetical protein